MSLNKSVADTENLTQGGIMPSLDLLTIEHKGEGAPFEPFAHILINEIDIETYTLGKRGGYWSVLFI